jgi:MFS family permease
MVNENQAASQSQSQGEKNEPQSTTEYQLKKYLLLLATLVATVTYAAGLNLPGGVWQDTQQGHTVGDPILPDTQHRRYLVFYYCNATAFTASLVVCLLVLGLDKKSQGPVAVLLRLVMLLDLLALMGAYAAGSCRDRFTTIYSLLLMSSVFAYIMPALVAFAISKLPATKIINKHHQDNNTTTSSNSNGGDNSRREEMHETLMLLTTFAVAVTYVAGLNPPGGFWGNTTVQGQGGALPLQPHRVSHPVLKDHHPRRYQAFFVCNTTAFVVSLIIIMLLMDKKLTTRVSTRFVTLYGLVVVALMGLVGAYVAGSSRERDNTAYVIGLGIAVLACILLQLSLKNEMRQAEAIRALFDFAKERIQRLFVDDDSRYIDL